MAAPRFPFAPCIFTDEVSPDFEESCRRCAENGATHVELRGRLFGRDVTTLTDDDVGRMKRILAHYGLSVAILGSPFGKCDMNNPEEIARHHGFFPRLVQLCHEFGTDRIRGFAFWNPLRKSGRAERPDIQEYLPRIVDFLAPAVKQAEAGGVFLCLETEGATMTGTCRECRIVCDAVGSQNLGVTWDVLNSTHCGEMPLPEGYEQIRGKVQHLHIKPNRHKNLQTVGNTEIPYTRVFEALKADGYNGAASIEHWGSPDLMLAGLRALVSLLQG